MRTLRDLQRQFAEGVFDASRRACEADIHADGLDPARRMQVYRNNMYTGLSETLQAIFPVVARLVGGDYFQQCASQYTRLHPSRSGNLHDFGADFPAYLASLHSAVHLPYLADVARLEWAWHEAFHAADAGPLDIAALAKVMPIDYPRLRFRLHPSVRLLYSDYPILRIWETNQNAADEVPLLTLDAGGMQLLVLRRALTVEIQPLARGDAVLLEAFVAGADFASACAAALRSDVEFDITGRLRHYIQQGAVVGFEVLPGFPDSSGNIRVTHSK
jgi:hypothetical protein